MPLVSSAASLLSNEWERFQDGIRRLNPNDQRRIYDEIRRAQILAGTPATVTIPGWDDIIHIQPRPQPTPAQVNEYWRARRANRDPDLPPDIRDELDRKREVTRRIRTSASPEYAKAFGSILTSLDNVQDMLSTLATFGRLAMWIAPRLAGRMLPGVGLIILAADILNLMSFLTMAATPLYALLCGGIGEAFAAGMPSLLFKQALKRETWKMANLNPWSSRARFTRTLRAAPRLPGFSNLIEVAQTMDQLFGVGLSLGGIMGALQEAMYGSIRTPGTTAVSGVINPSQAEWSALMQNRGRSYTEARRILGGTAASILANGPAIATVQDHFTTAQHIEYYAALQAAVEIMAEDLHGLPWQPILARAMAHPLRPLYAPDQATAAAIEETGVGRFRRPLWWTPGNPETIMPERYIDHVSREVPWATRQFIEPRRNSPDGMFAGLMVNQITHALWLMIDPDPGLLKFEFATDQRIISGMAEQGIVISPAAPEHNVMPLWEDLRDITETKNRQTLCECTYTTAARRHNVPFLRLLPTETPLPLEWETSRDNCPSCGGGGGGEATQT